jgi:hypothetical protein
VVQKELLTAPILSRSTGLPSRILALWCTLLYGLMHFVLACPYASTSSCPKDKDGLFDEGLSILYGLRSQYSVRSEVRSSYGFCNKFCKTRRRTNQSEHNSGYNMNGKKCELMELTDDVYFFTKFYLTDFIELL